MATLRNNDNYIEIGIDPGFDGTKVCINGIMFKVPNNIMDITGKKNEFLTLGERKAGGYICSRYIRDKEYLIGELARKSINEKLAKANEKIKMTVNDSQERFGTMDFECNMMSVIGIALIEYAKETMRNEWRPCYTIMDSNKGDGNRVIPSLKTAEIVVGVALPHDYVDSVWPNISKFLIGEHHFEIELQDGIYELNFEIKPGRAIPASQAICALLGTAADDEGVIKNESNILKNLPALVIDGGYKTVGLFQLTKAYQVSEAESNENFAMGNVHKRVAKILQEEFGRTDIEAFSIPSIIENDDGKIICINPNNHGTIELDVTEMINEEVAKICEELLDYLNEKYNNLLDTKEVIITGGTGAAYYDHVAKYLNEQRNHLRGKIILTSYKFRGQEIEPVYAIAVGMYKTLKHQVNVARKAQKEEAQKTVAKQTNKDN